MLIQSQQNNRTRQRDIENAARSLTTVEYMQVLIFAYWLLFHQMLKKLPPAQRIAIYIVSSLTGGALILFAIQSGNVGIGILIGALLMALIIFVSRV